jgi:hypothetical protein
MKELRRFSGRPRTPADDDKLRVGNCWGKFERDRSAAESHRNCGPVACRPAKDHPQKIKIRTTPPIDGLKPANQAGVICRFDNFPPRGNVVACRLSQGS